MQRHGFIHDMMDVKVLILFVTSRANYPLNSQEIYELCYQDECLSYFDVCTAIPEMVQSGHLEQLDGDSYQITDKGRKIIDDSRSFFIEIDKKTFENFTDEEVEQLMYLLNKMKKSLSEEEGN